MAKCAIRIERNNISEIMHLPCITQCLKTVSGNLRFKGEFEPRNTQAKVGDWLVQITDKQWKLMSNRQYERIKDSI